MKKKICTLLVLIASVVSAYATDGITAKDVTIKEGGTAILEIEMTNAKPYGALEFKMTLPEGFSVTNIQKTERITSAEVGGNTFTLQKNNSDVATNEWTVLCYNTNQMEIAGESGTVILLTLKTENLGREIGTELEGQLYGIVLSTPEATPQQTNGATSTFKITIGDGRLIFDEGSAILPSYTAGETANVTVFRTIKKNEWSTIVLPFNMTKAHATKAFGTDAQYAKFTGFTADYGDDLNNMAPLSIKISCVSYEFPARGNLPGGTPILVKTTKDITEPIQLDDVKLVGKVTGVEGNDKTDDYETPGLFTGTFVKTKIPADGLFLSNNQFWYSTGKTSVKGFRCWFELGAVLDKDTNFGSRITLSFEDPTGINEIKVVEDDRYYNLSGQQVKPAKKGLYIQNGKKKIIK